MKKVLSTLVVALAIMATSSEAQETGKRIVMQPGDKREVVLEDKQSVTFEFRLPTPGSCRFSLSTESAEVVTLGMGIMNALIKKGQPMIILITRDANNPEPTKEFVNATGRKTDAINVELSPMTTTSGAQEAVPNVESRYIAHDYGPGSSYELNAKGSTDGKITVFGLTFTENCTCTVLEDRTLAVDKEGIVTRDAKGNTWTSHKATLNGTEIICFFPSAAAGKSQSTHVDKAAEPSRPAKPETLLPPFKAELRGANPVRVRNPNNFSVATGLRAGEKGRNFDVPANGVNTVYVPNGPYDIYFVYSDKPDALFQGDSFTLNNNGVEIQIVKVVNGNYGIRQVK